VEDLFLKSNNYTIKQYIKKRIICSIVDFILFAFLLGISFGFMGVLKIPCQSDKIIKRIDNERRNRD